MAYKRFWRISQAELSGIIVLPVGSIKEAQGNILYKLYIILSQCAGPFKKKRNKAPCTFCRKYCFRERRGLETVFGVLVPQLL